MKIDFLGPIKPGYQSSTRLHIDRPSETDEIRKISREIKSIENQTNYIKDTGNPPPPMHIDYKKRLDIL